LSLAAKIILGTAINSEYIGATRNTLRNEQQCAEQGNQEKKRIDYEPEFFIQQILHDGSPFLSDKS
jgi:hypothetical protein